MVLDLPTLMVAVALVSAVAGGAVLYVGVSSRTSGRSLSTWGAALLLYAIQPIAFGWRFNGPLAPSVAASNAIAVLVLMVQWDAVARFSREQSSPDDMSAHVVVGPTLPAIAFVTLAAGVSVLLLLPYEFARNVFGTSLLAAIATTLWIATYRVQSTHELPARGRQLLLGGTLALIAMLCWRLYALLNARVTATELQQTAPIHATTYLATILTMLLQTLGFVLWHKECAVEREHSLAEHDALTGCLNRRALFGRANGLLRTLSRRSRALGVMVLDLDHFKQINDRHGHLAGDAVLREVANRLQHRLRASDMLARFGGEEFLILADDTSEAGVRALAEELREAIAATPVMAHDTEIVVTVSIGVSCHDGSDGPATIDGIIAAADSALYRAKSAGRNCVR